MKNKGKLRPGDVAIALEVHPDDAFCCVRHKIEGRMFKIYQCDNRAGDNELKPGYFAGVLSPVLKRPREGQRKYFTGIKLEKID